MPHTNEDTEKEIENEEAQTEDLQPNLQTGSITVQKDGHFIHCLTVIGQIEGHYILPSQNKTTKYEHVIPQLVAIEESDDVEGLLIILNTVGGDVEAGLAIAELLSTMQTPTASLVLGGGHSIGVPLAVSCRRSFIVPSATMTVHPVRMNGLVLGVPQTLSYFEKMQDRIVRFISTAPLRRSTMLWTVISQADVFYQAAQGSRAPRSSNPFDYLNNGYSLEGASLFGGQDHVVFNCDISSRRTGSHLGTPGV